MTSSTLRRLWLALTLQLIAMAVWAPNVGAHAAYESSNPEDGASVSSPPSQVTADFTEPVIDESYLQVIDPCGEQVDNGDSFVTADRIAVSMSADKAGTYTAKFWVVSSVDGHNTAGEFTFSSSGGDGCVEEEAPVEKDTSGNSGGGGSSKASTGDGGSRSGSDTNSGVTAASGNTKAQTDKGRASTTRKEAAAKSANREKRGSAGSVDDQAVGDFGPVELAQEPGPFDGMLWGTFAVGLALAALIGAAGGFVYAGIMGYTSNRS